MGTAAKATRDNRTITVDFRDEATYFHLLSSTVALWLCCKNSWEWEEGLANSL
jgi:hypothetical protein